jgi:hypothetical protein
MRVIRLFDEANLKDGNILWDKMVMYKVNLPAAGQVALYTGKQS